MGGLKENYFFFLGGIFNLIAFAVFCFFKIYDYKKNIIYSKRFDIYDVKHFGFVQ